MSNDKGNINTIIIDNGSSYIKAGFKEEDALDHISQL